MVLLPSPVCGPYAKGSKTYIGPMLVAKVVSAINARIQKNRRSKLMLVHVDNLKLCKGDTPKARLSGVERDATELMDAEDEEEVRQPPEEHGDELQ